MKQPLIALDQMLNCFVWSAAEGFGRADETLSARAYRLSGRGSAAWGWFRAAVDTLFFWEDEHCHASFLAEVERRQLPREYREGRGPA